MYGNGEMVMKILRLRMFAHAMDRYQNTPAKDIDWSDKMILAVRDIEFKVVRETT